MMFTDRYTWPILGAIIACTLPHFRYLSPWVPLACMVMWVYAGAAARYALPLPSGSVLKIAAGFFFLAAMTTHEGFTIEAFLALLALMACLKLLEIKSGRDRVITIILCYFLIAGGFLFKDSIGATMYILLSILLTTAVLVHVNRSAAGVASSLKVSAVLMLQALPVTLILFLLFPRVQGGLWGRTHLNTARTGFDDKLAFGAIAELARSTEVAFRVDFAGAVPPQDKLYWRGAVLWEFDGRTWRRGMGHHDEISPRPGPGPLTDYTLTLEPHNEHWLFTLDRPVEIDFRWTRLLGDYSVYRWRPITGRVSYRASSEVDRPPSVLSRFHEQKGLQLPPAGNPDSRDLARRLFAEAGEPAAYVRLVLEYFREQPFYYTLQPPVLAGGENDLIDRFLFVSRRGFCEHFAGTFAFLMRAAGLPARVVVGYQGGTRNQFGGYLVVRQAEAHAWCEVWLEGVGWQRVDPTSVVSPERISGGAAGSRAEGEGGGWFPFLGNGPWGQWLDDVGAIWDYWNTYWNRWVMTYSVNEQTGLFSRLGVNVRAGEATGRILLFSLIPVMLVIVGISLLVFREVRPDRDETAEAWLTFCRKLARVGLDRDPAMGPAAYLDRITELRPDLAGPARGIVRLYVQVRYAGRKSDIKVRTLKERVKKFSPGKSAR